MVTKEDYLMSLLPNLNQLSSPNRFGTVTFESLGEGILNGRSGPLLLFALLSGGKKIIRTRQSRRYAENPRDTAVFRG